MARGVLRPRTAYTRQLYEYARLNTATNDNSSQEPGIKAASTRRWTIGTVLFSAVALIPDRSNDLCSVFHHPA